MLQITQRFASLLHMYVYIYTHKFIFLDVLYSRRQYRQHNDGRFIIVKMPVNRSEFQFLPNPHIAK